MIAGILIALMLIAAIATVVAFAIAIEHVHHTRKHRQ